MKDYLYYLIGFILIIAAYVSKFKQNNKNIIPVPTPIPKPLPDDKPLVPVIPTPPAPPAPNTDLKFEKWPSVSKRVNEDTLYADIINHAKKPVISYNRSTNAHESTHMINSDIRNSFRQSKGNLTNTFYLGFDNFFKCKEPNILKSEVEKYIPEELRFNRFKLYIQGQREWNDRPLYIVDEYVSYINGGKVSIENVKIGKNDTKWTDGVSGCLEFSIYTIGLCMAIDENTDYWKKNEEFRNFIAYLLKSAYETYNDGKDMPEFKWDKQDTLLLNFKQHNGKLKDFMKKYNLGLFWVS